MDAEFFSAARPLTGSCVQSEAKSKEGNCVQKDGRLKISCIFMGLGIQDLSFAHLGLYLNISPLILDVEAIISTLTKGHAMKESNLIKNVSSPMDLQGKVTIKNRLYKSAMSEQLGDRTNAPTQALPVLYETWARGGAGLLITGNVMIDRRALGEPYNVALEDDRDMEAFKDWARAGTINNTQLWMQLNHPGKQIPRFLSKEPVAPSAIPLGYGLEKSFNPPRALTVREIRDLIERFATSAVLAKEAGFTGVQIHGAHGYLVSQFLSPRHNQRNDDWGGSPENRLRFVVEVYRAIRARVGNAFPVGIKLNSADFQKDGFSEQESMSVVGVLEQEGIDMVEVSGGTYERPAMVGAVAKASTLVREAYFLDYAKKVRETVTVPLGVTGGFRSGSAMNAAIHDGDTDMIGLARPLALYPDMPNRLFADPDFGVSLKRPDTGVKTLNQMAMLDITWYESQLALMGKGKSADPKYSPWLTILHMFSQLGKNAFKKRRA